MSVAGAAPGAGGEFRLSGAQKLIIFTAVMASLLEIVDTSIVNVAIPSMMGNLGATIEDISWVVVGYIIANAIVLPIAAWLGMQIGRKKYYVGCILLFTATSVACGLAPNLFTLVVFRILQGFAGGALLPTSQALIQEQFPRDKAGMGSAIYGMGVMVGPTLGPTLGGYLTDNFGWRSIFNINLPLGLLAAFLAYLHVEDIKIPGEQGASSGQAASGQRTSRRRVPIDGVGLALLMIGVGCLQFILERGQADDWFDSWAIIVTSVLAAITLPGFVWWELRTPHPIVDLRLFRHGVVRSGTMLMTLLGGFLYTLVFLLPVFVATVLGYTATQTGELFIPGALFTAMLMPMIGAQLRKHDPRRFILIGFGFTAVCALMMSTFTAQTGANELFWPLMVRGMGMPFLFIPINTVVLGSFSGPALGQVAGLMNLSRQIGGSIGIAVISTLQQRVARQHYLDLTSHVSLLSPAGAIQYLQGKAAMASRLVGAVGFAPPDKAALKTLHFRILKQVTVLSFDRAMVGLAIATACGLIPLAFMKRPQRPASTPVDLH